MKYRAPFVFVVLAMLLLLGAGTVMAQTGDPVKGKATWAQKNCKSCHGENGEGKFAAPRAGDGFSVEAWIKQVRTPRSMMPAFRPDQVSDQDIADMNAYMQTLPKPASFTPAPSIAKEGDPQGKVLFAQKRCQACHGDGTGLVKSRFTDQGRTVTTEAVIKQLRSPLQNMPMFNATQVTDAEAGTIATYLASLQAAPAPAAAPGPATAPAATPVGKGVAPSALPSTGDGSESNLPGLLLLAGMALISLSGRVLARVRP